MQKKLPATVQMSREKCLIQPSPCSLMYQGTKNIRKKEKRKMKKKRIAAGEWKKKRIAQPNWMKNKSSSSCQTRIDGKKKGEANLGRRRRRSKSRKEEENLPPAAVECCSNNLLLRRRRLLLLIVFSLLQLQSEWDKSVGLGFFSSKSILANSECSDHFTRNGPKFWIK